MAWALAQWQHLVALHEAMDTLHWMMHIAPCRPGGMVIKIIVNLTTFFYIVDYKRINYSFMFTILLSCFNHALAQPLIHIPLVLDWVTIKFVLTEGEMDHHGGGVCVMCSIVKPYYSYIDKFTRWEFLFPPEAYSG
jgi:hypothetical protein